MKTMMRGLILLAMMVAVSGCFSASALVRRQAAADNAEEQVLTHGKWRVALEELNYFAHGGVVANLEKDFNLATSKVDAQVADGQDIATIRQQERANTIAFYVGREKAVASRDAWSALGAALEEEGRIKAEGVMRIQGMEDREREARMRLAVSSFQQLLGAASAHLAKREADKLKKNPPASGKFPEDGYEPGNS